MTVADLEFPVLCFWRKYIEKQKSFETLTLTSSIGVKNGRYKEMLIVDGHGTSFRIKDARKLHGVGWFWGFHPFYGQRIRVEFIIESGPTLMSVEEVRELVFRSFRRYSGWNTMYDHKEQREKVKNATAVGEIISALKCDAFDYSRTF